jgi:hypothetical protein
MNFMFGKHRFSLTSFGDTACPVGGWRFGLPGHRARSVDLRRPFHRKFAGGLSAFYRSASLGSKMGQSALRQREQQKPVSGAEKNRDGAFHDGPGSRTYREFANSCM